MVRDKHTLIERFLKKIRRTSREHWIWTSTTVIERSGDKGRKKPVMWNGEKKVYATRLSYELFRGPIPFGKEIVNVCGYPFCVAPNHLEARSKMDLYYYKP